jgi:hypothetical protein
MADTIDNILRVFAECNLFEEGVELIGSWCFNLYQRRLGVKKFPLITLDIDFLVPIPFNGKEHLDFTGKLEELGFQVDFKRDGSVYFWNSELKIEFITAEKGKGSSKAISIKKLGITAIPLRYVGFLMAQTITIMDRGIKVRVPAPVNFCLHKLIVASQRKKMDKKLKDLQQAIYTSAIVEPQEMRKLFNSLPKKWRQTILKILDRSKTELPLLIKEIESLEITL